MASDLQRKAKRVIAEDGTVLFVGAGVSVWSGIPGWGRLLNDMADFVDTQGSNSAGIRKYKDTQPLLAADLAKKELTEAQYYEFLNSAICDDTSKPAEIHQLLLNLGINCFITTNFDQLLERAIGINGKSPRFKVITNTDVQKCADLCAIKSRNFIFKPHGDIKDADSIVLTNTDYCDMYENGRRFYAHRTLDTLLATRNIVFVGFGLTDPDFLCIMNRFRNDYKQSVVEKYAIMPDVSEEEIKYWKETYGINILSYETVTTENGRDYSGLLKLLKVLAPSGKKKILNTVDDRAEVESITQKQRKALAVYAQSVIARFEIDKDVVYPLELKSNMGERNRTLLTEELLKQEKRGFALTGTPGSGKTFFMKQYTVSQAKRLFDWCQTRKRKDMPLIPVYIDLKNYCGPGCVDKMAEEQFPDEALIQHWMDEGKILYLLDSYNEIEAQYLENRDCRKELELLIFIKDAVVASRTEIWEGGYHNFKLEAIGESYVIDYLYGNGLGKFAEDPVIINIFQSPLFFQLLQNGRINLEQASTVKDVYFSYFDYLMKNIKEKLDISIDIISVLRRFAFELFEQGAETFSLELIAVCLKQEIQGLTDIKCRDLLNFLMDQLQFLVPLPEERAMFFHQSVTEFLAASYLPACSNWMHLLEENLENVRWDQVFLFGTGFFDERKALEYISALLKTDSVLAAQSVEYAQEGRDEGSMLILEYLCRHSDEELMEYYINLEEADVRLPVNRKHENILRKLMEKGNLLGGIAAGWLLSVYGDSVKEEMIELIFRHCGDDYNFVSRTAGALCDYITVEDYKKIIIRLRDYETDSEDGLLGFDDLARGFSLDEILEMFKEAGGLNHVQRMLCAQILLNEKSVEAFQICLKIYLNGWDEMMFPLYMKIQFEDFLPEQSIEELIDRVMYDIEYSEERWSIDLLYCLYHKSDAAAKYVRSRLKYTGGIVRLAFYYVIGKNRTESFFRLFFSMLYWQELPEGIIDKFNQIDWKENAGRVIQILYRQNRIKLLERFLNSFLDSIGRTECSLRLDIEVLTILLTILDSCQDSYTRYVIGKLIGENAVSDTLVRLYNLLDEGLKVWMRIYVFPYARNLKMEDFTKEDIHSMLEDLKIYDLENDIVYADELLLVNIVDEEFIYHILEPMLSEKDDILRRNLKRVLEKAGEVYNKRYVSR